MIGGVSIQSEFSRLSAAKIKRADRKRAIQPRCGGGGGAGGGSVGLTGVNK